MNKQEQEREDRLWDYIDGSGDNAMRSEIERLLDSHAEWRDKYKELLALHQMINQSELEAPSMRFTKNVMEEIAKYKVAPATRNYINKKVILGIGAGFGSVILVFLVYLFSHLHWSNDQLGETTVHPLGNWDAGSIITGTVGLSKWLSSTWVQVFLLINTVVGLVFFDMYLRRKKSQKIAE